MTTSLNNQPAARELGYQAMQYVCGRVTLNGADANVKIGRIPAGAVITALSSKVVTAITGGTPVLAVGTASGGSQVQGTMAESAGSEWLTPVAGLVMPLAADTDIWAGTSGGATAGDAIISVFFIKPLS